MARREEGFFKAKDDLRLFWESTLPEASVPTRAHLAIVHGYADHAGRYRKTIEDLAAQGIAVHAFDYRGHGQSDGRRGHCDQFSEFLDDLELFWGRVQERAGGQRTFLLGHSHGGLMSVLFAAQKPAGLAGLVLSGPYLGLAVKANPVQVIAGRAIAKLLPWLPQKLPLPPDTLTRDEAVQRLVAEDPLYNRTLTVGWFVQAESAQKQALTLGPALTGPLLTFFGAEDQVASTGTTKEFFATVASSDKRMKEYAGMRHECLNEIGREQVVRDIASWISERL